MIEELGVNIRQENYKYSEGVKALSPFIWKASESNGG
jgi:hypothetical protein